MTHYGEAGSRMFASARLANPSKRWGTNEEVRRRTFVSPAASLTSSYSCVCCMCGADGGGRVLPALAGGRLDQRHHAARGRRRTPDGQPVLPASGCVAFRSCVRACVRCLLDKLSLCKRERNRVLRCLNRSQGE